MRSMEEPVYIVRAVEIVAQYVSVSSSSFSVSRLDFVQFNKACYRLHV